MVYIRSSLIVTPSYSKSNCSTIYIPVLEHCISGRIKIQQIFIMEQRYVSSVKTTVITVCDNEKMKV